MTETPDDTSRVVAETRAERTRLVELLAALPPTDWGRESLCAGWQVREVVAHLTMPYRISTPEFFAGLLRARFSVNRYADRDAHAATSTRSDEDLLTLLRENIEHPWRPPGGGAVGALSHDVIHGLDLTEPLGLPRCPAERIGLVLAHTSPKSLRHFGVDLGGSRLVATDADVSVGEGAETRLSAADILLVLSGRRSLTAVTRER